MLDVAQLFAWTRMFAGYVRTESLASAAHETFDPAKPCAICRAVQKARDAAGKHGAAVTPDNSPKIVIILDSLTCSVSPSVRRAWPPALRVVAPLRSDEVPVPPPRPVAVQGMFANLVRPMSEPQRTERKAAARVLG
jgi:hypothetical protein